MKRINLYIVLILLGPVTFAATATDEAFQNLADEYISDLANFSPVYATYVGDHSADDKLDIVDAAARAEDRELLVEYIDALEALDLDDLSRANQIDAEILMNQLRSEIGGKADFPVWPRPVQPGRGRNPWDGRFAAP